MKRDMDLIRLILLKIEDEYTSHNIIDLAIDGYDMETVAYHCKILYEVGFVSYYDGLYSMSGLDDFQVGSLTWAGNDYLEKVRDKKIWDKTKETIKAKGLPMLIETIKTITSTAISAATEGAVSAMLNGKV